MYAAFFFKTHLYIDGDLTISRFGTLSNLIYSFMRCHLLHEGEVDDHIIFLERESDQVFGHDDGKFMVSHQLIMGLILLVIGDPVNRAHSFNRQWMTGINDKILDLGTFWGQLSEIKSAVGFEDMPDDFFDQVRAEKAS